MTSEYYAELRREALHLVNMARIEMDLPPLEDFPKGKPYSTYHCPVANALFGEDNEDASIYELAFTRNPKQYNAMIEAWNIEHWPAVRRDWLVGVKTPDKIFKFANAFDDGVYPDLIDNSS